MNFKVRDVFSPVGEVPLSTFLLEVLACTSDPQTAFKLLAEGGSWTLRSIFPLCSYSFSFVESVAILVKGSTFCKLWRITTQIPFWIEGSGVPLAVFYIKENPNSSC